MGRWIPFVLAALLAVGLIARDHDRPLVNGDEAVYAEFARTWGGDPSATRWDGVAVHQRPPLYVALLAAAHALGGAGEAPLRAVSALAAAAAVLAAAALARRTTSDPRHANAAGTLAAVLTAGSGFFLHWGAAIESDLVLAALIAWSIERFAARALITAAILCACAALVKQVVGFLPLAAVFAWAIARDREPIPRRTWLLAAATFALVWLPWHIYATIRHGGAVWHGLWVVNAVARAASPVFEPTSPGFYFAAALRREGVVLSLFLAFGLVHAIRRARARTFGPLLAIVPPLAALAAFSLAATRIEYYVLVAVPLVAAAVGAALAPGIPPLVAGAVLAIALATHGVKIPPPTPADLSARTLARAAAAAHPAHLVVIGLQPSSPRAYAGVPVTRLVPDDAEAARWRAIDVLAVPGVIERAADPCAHPLVVAGAPVITLATAPLPCRPAPTLTEGPYALQPP